MGWKTINGNRYYYKTSRIGTRVRTEYVGNSEVAMLIAQLDKIENRERVIRQAEEKEAREEWRAVEEKLDEMLADARSAVAEVLKAAGYHQHHRGEWRKRRG
jgi:hypothetical protein